MQFQHVIITGGSSGIGKAIALQLAASSARITLIARTLAQLEAAKAEIAALSSPLCPEVLVPKVLILSADVAQVEQITDAIQMAIAQFGPPDLLITSAGIAHPGHFEALPLEVFERTMAINYFGTLYSIKAVLPAMQHQQKGHIVLVSSGAGLIGVYGYTPYSPSKFALRGLAESLRGELKPAGIYVSIVYPPDTDTPQLKAENRTKPLATQKITATAKTWTATAVAKVVIQEIQRRSFAIAPGLEMGLLNRFHSVITPIIQWYCDRQVAQSGDSKPR